MPTVLFEYGRFTSQTELRLSLCAHQQTGDVIVSAGLLRCLHKARRKPFKREIAVEQNLNRRVRKLTRQSVRAEQKQITRLRFELKHIRCYMRLCPERTRNHVLQRRVLG